jgi:hypothetical protein
MAQPLFTEDFLLLCENGREIPSLVQYSHNFDDFALLAIEDCVGMHKASPAEAHRETAKPKDVVEHARWRAEYLEADDPQRLATRHLQNIAKFRGGRS